MFDIKRKTIDWGGRKLTLETGRMARQADGAVLATYGETMVLATAVFAKQAKAGQDFFPLTVNYQEKFYAAGKIPGSFPRREGAPSQKETLTSRLIDRPIRPLFVKGFKNEVQVVATVLAHDLENDPDIVALVASSAALVLSGVPFMGPIGAARVGFIDRQYVLNPTLDQMKEGNRMDLVVAGTAEAVMMVESEIQELSEDEVLGGVTFAHKEMQPVIDAIIELAEHAAKEPFDFEAEDTDKLKAELKKLIGKDLRAAYEIKGKAERHAAIGAAKDKGAAALAKSESKPDGADPQKLAGVFKDLEADIVRRDILERGVRIDGRRVDQVRPIVCEVGVLSRAHGSALFTRGETQALVVATLGTGEDEQLIDALEGKRYENFMLHYNFPPFSVGETGRMGAPGRREVGHGKLAWRAIRPMLPSAEEFPYTLRLVSEIFESNGSSSMASVCGSSLALMDAGVPLKKPVSGIAMGLILEKDGFAVLSDILGDEDHLGDMDFKVAGTHEGITSLQMDIKIPGITEAIMRQALAQAKDGREHILGEMGKAMEAPRAHLGEYAPKIETMKIPVDKIREVIGSGGKVIREIVEKTGAKIDIGEDGTIKIAAAEQAKIDAAREWIKGITSEPEVGQIYTGKVVKIVDFGAFVNFFGSKDGLVHVSQIANHRVDKVSDVLREGQSVKVKLLGFDDRGKTRLSMKIVDQETGEDLSKKQEQPEPAEA
ncbi:polyribonucleotide nucleotidyltransferase [Phenylobacterium sp.]|uniref:polyribonucleotide nucleotidyltransferase n=1 Tax=Phenylobacterium sp. TaxID=1871053 RepID=UPI00260C2F2F|nr:polyribonucleotide nucleotidyltransferase [Phenylobacterium sp.]